MAHLVFSNTKEEINRVLRLIQNATATGAATTPATPASLGNSFVVATGGGGSGSTYNLAPVIIYPFLCDASGNLVTDSEGFLSTSPTIVAKFA